RICFRIAPSLTDEFAAVTRRGELGFYRAVPLLRPDRLDARTNQHRGIRALPRNELLRASVIDLGGVQIALLVHVHAVHAPEAAREVAEGAPGVQKVSF